MLPLYVQRDDHALGLIRLLTVALRLLTIIEFVVRRSLAKAEQTITGLYDGNPTRQTATPSVALLLNVFDNISLTTITQADQIIGQHLTPLTTVQRRILDLLDLSPHIYESLADFSTSSSITKGGVRPINDLPC